ncbi:MAG: class I SAM-dependent methyltransferase [Anaerolineae bacterium]|nr:class I SAM-dependent methyltransferase [Anaerolineae bacterium]
MDEYQKTNLELWNTWTEIHEKSGYDIEGFRSGKSSLHAIELAELGDVRGKSLLHLQCHFGLDTLSWARMGAIVTSVDFSDKAIALARRLSRELDIPARFVQADIYDLTAVLTGEFDVVFTSYGVLCWLSDLQRWAEIVALYLKPGGIFYIVESHPFSHIFDDATGTTALKIVGPYFASPEAQRWDGEGSYAGPGPYRVWYEWRHTLGEIITALASAGLKIEYVHEYPYVAWQALPMMVEGEDHYWRLPGQENAIPFMFSIKATKG